MKTFKLDNEPKIETGFTVPENYFENFSAKMMQQLPKNEPKVISIFTKKKTWMYAAAAILVLALSLPIYNNYFSRSSEIDETTLDLSKVLVLSNVKIKNQSNGMEMKYTLVAESEADLKTGKISVTSPIGRGLLGKKVGEVAEITVPNGVLKFEILEVSRD